MVVDASRIEPARLRGLRLLRKNREQRMDSDKLAKSIALLFRDYVNLSRCKSVEELLVLIQAEGDYLLSLYPSEFIVHNTLCTTLSFIREEAQKLAFGNDEELTAFDSLNKLWSDPKGVDLNVDMKELRKNVMGSLEEYDNLLESSNEELATQAQDHVLPSDKIMTFRFSESSTLQNFLKNAKCTILSVDDRSASNDKKSSFTAIPSTDIVVTMNSVTRVVLSAIAVLTDGSCITPAGTCAVCEVAKHHSVPVIICSAFYKFTPIFFPNLHELNRNTTSEAKDSNNKNSHLRIANPLFDHIPAKLVSLYVTQEATVTPLHVYRILKDNFHPAELYRFKA